MCLDICCHDEWDNPFVIFILSPMYSSEALHSCEAFIQDVVVHMFIVSSHHFHHYIGVNFHPVIVLIAFPENHSFVNCYT